MPAKFCLGCGELTRNGSRCEDCQQERDARINARPKGNTTQRGLGYAHRVKAKAVVVAAQVCTRCQQPPSPSNPLTAHHTTARAKGGGESPMVALCRRCNSAIGDRTGGGT